MFAAILIHRDKPRRTVTMKPVLRTERATASRTIGTSRHESCAALFLQREVEMPGVRDGRFEISPSNQVFTHISEYSAFEVSADGGYQRAHRPYCAAPVDENWKPSWSVASMRFQCDLTEFKDYGRKRPIRVHHERDDNN